MDLKSPFDNQSGLQAHQDFSQAAHGTVARKISMGLDKSAGAAAGRRVLLQSDIDKSKEQQNYPRDRVRMKCPHCKKLSLCRTSKEESVLTRSFVYCCSNFECGHVFKAVMEIHYTISPSATPDPSVDLPMSTHVRRDLLRAQMDGARSAEHQAESTEPITGDLFSGLPGPAAQLAP